MVHRSMGKAGLVPPEPTAWACGDIGGAGLWYRQDNSGAGPLVVADGEVGGVMSSIEQSLGGGVDLDFILRRKVLRSRPLSKAKASIAAKLVGFVA